MKERTRGSIMGECRDDAPVKSPRDYPSSEPFCGWKYPRDGRNERRIPVADLVAP